MSSSDRHNNLKCILCAFHRSCERSLRSLDHDSPPKKKKLQPTYTSTTHLLAGKKCPSSLQTKSNDLETTVFYIPGVDVKVSTSAIYIPQVLFFSIDFLFYLSFCSIPQLHSLSSSSSPTSTLPFPVHPSTAWRR